MTFFRHAVFAIAALCAAYAPAADLKMLPGEVSNFELPNFDKDTGRKLWELFGEKAKFSDEKKIDVSQMRLDIFDAKTAARKILIQSRSASYDMDSKIVTSPDAIFVKADEFDIRGDKWSWNGEKNVVEIRSDVVMNFSPKQEGRRDAQTGVAVAPTTVSGDYASFEDRDGGDVFSVKGNAKVRSQDMGVDCDSIRVITDDKLKNEKNSGGTSTISSIEARGNVKMKRNRQSAVSEEALILPREDEAELSGNPEITDIPSKAKLSGYKMFFLKKSKSLRAVSSPDGKQRAAAVFLHAEAGSGKMRQIRVESDSIEMSAGEKNNEFVFDGNVNVASDDFSASCKKITVLAKNSENEKPEVDVIQCRGKIHLKNPDGDAYAAAMDIFPKEEKTRLNGSVKLVNAEDGTTLEADTLTLLKKQNSGEATAKKRGFVSLAISERTAAGSAQLGGAGGGKSGLGKTLVKSRLIKFARAGDTTKFAFEKDVFITSKDIRATCGNMFVYSVSKKNNSSKLAKIEAFDKVRITQNEYSASAEAAAIYPKDADGKASHKFVELWTPEREPKKRPRIMLPPLKNMGFETPSAARKVRPKMTVVESDRQWLTSAGENKKYLFEGDGKITATDTEGSCDKIEVTIPPAQKNKRREISDIVLKGRVNIAQAEKKITCGKAHIYVADEAAVLTENPVIFNAEDGTRAAGSKIVYNKGSKLVSIQEEPQAEESDDGDSVKSKRPTIVLPEF